MHASTLFVIIHETTFSSNESAFVICICSDIEQMKSDVRVYCIVFIGIGVAALLSSISMFYAFAVMGNKLALRVRILLFRSLMRQVGFI